MAFTNRIEITNAVNSNNNALTRSVEKDLDTDTDKNPVKPDCPGLPAEDAESIVSLTDTVRSDDPILNQISEEERQIILEEKLTYYDLYGCDEYIPSLNFAKILNSRREIQMGDSVYKITELGVFRAHEKNKENIENAYEALEEDSSYIEGEKYEDFIGLEDGVEFRPYKEMNDIIEENGQEDNPTTRSSISDIPTSGFKHYSTQSKTVLGRILSALFGKRSVKHDEFEKNKHRVSGSLYSYNYYVYHETGCFVSMNKKRGGLFKFINGWKDIPASELYMQYNGIVLEVKTEISEKYGNISSSSRPTVASYSDVRIHGLGNVVKNTVDIFGYNVKEKDLFQFVGKNSKQLFTILKGWLGNSQSLEQHYSNGSVPAARIITPTTVYMIIANDTYNVTKTKKLRKVFDAGSSFTISYNPATTFWSNALTSLKQTKEMPVKRLIGGEVLLAGRLNGKWGGMYIKQYN